MSRHSNAKYNTISYEENDMTSDSLGTLPKDPLNMAGGWPPIAIMPCARHNQVGECMLVIMASPNWHIRTSKGGDVIRDKGARDLVCHHQQCSLNPHQCQRSSGVGIGQPNNTMDYLEIAYRRVFSNQTMHQATLVQTICSEVVATLKSQCNGITSRSEGDKKQRLAFIQQ